MAHFLCHLGAHILEPFCSISILPKTVPEVAKLLRVNKNMVYDLIRCGYLRSMKLGSRKVSRKALLEFVEEFDGKTVELPGVQSE